MYKRQQISLCIEGVFYITGIACAAVATQSGIAAGLHPLLCILVAGVLGALICAIPALMYIRFCLLYTSRPSSRYADPPVR